MELVAALDQAIDAERNALIGLVCELIAAPTVNPPGNEAAAAVIVERWLRNDGIEWTRHEREPGRTNLVTRIGSGEGPSLLVACHLDVVPAGDGWESDPFVARVEDGRIVGRGAADNKGQLGSMLLLLRALRKAGINFRGTLIFAAVADEERGSTLGLDYLIDECGLRADCAIIPDVLHNMRMIDVAEKGVIFVKVTAHGKQAHGSSPEKGVNAIVAMADLVRDLREHPLPSAEHRYLSPTTVNVGRIEGGSAPNIVPAKCSVELDIRYPPGKTREDILAALDAAMARIGAIEPGRSFEREILADLPPTEVDPNHPIVTLIQRHTEAVLGEAAQPDGLSGATVTKQLIMRGIPAIGFAPGDADAAHTANESIEIDELIDFAKIIGRVCIDYLGV